MMDQRTIIAGAVILGLFLMAPTLMHQGEDYQVDLLPADVTVTGTGGAYLVSGNGGDKSVVGADSAISTAISRLGAGDVLTLDGTFAISSSITMRSNMALQLDGTVSRASTGALVYASGLSSIQIRGGNWVSHDAQTQAFYIISCSNVDVIGCDVKGAAIALSGCKGTSSDYCKVVHNTCHDVNSIETRQGITISMSALYIEVAYNVIRNNVGGGIYLWNADGASYSQKSIHVHHNTVTDVMTDGISLYPGGSGNSCTNCIIEHNVITQNKADNTHTLLAVAWGGGGGDTTKGCDNNIVRYNTLNNNAGSVLKENLCIRGDYNQVYGNVINGAYKSGIKLMYSDGNTIQGNVINGCRATTSEEGNCISLWADSDSNIIKDNVLKSPCVSFLLINSGCDGNKITGNDLQGTSSSTSIRNYGSGNVLSGNG